MQEKLVIYLNSAPLSDSSQMAGMDGAPSVQKSPLLGWAIIANGEVKESVYQADPKEVSLLAEEREVILIVPAEDVLLTFVNLPKMNRSKLIQAIPYALEEQLTEDVDVLHFAAGPYQADNSLSVAIVSQVKMEQWMACMNSWNIKPDALIPASLAVPFVEKGWSVLLDKIAIVRTGLYQGFACDPSNLIEFLDVGLRTISGPPQVIQIHNYSQQAFVTPLNMKEVIEEQLADPQHLVSNLAQQIIKWPSINLLQGAYTVKKSAFAYKDKILKFMAGLSISWVLLLFFYPTVSYFILKQHANNLDTQIAQIYKRNFPQASSIVSPKLRMEEKLKKLGAGMGQNRLLLLLGYVGKGMEKALSVKLTRIDFQNNQLNLQLTAANSEEFSLFSDFLAQQGLRVKQQNANLKGSRINASLLIE